MLWRMLLWIVFCSFCLCSYKAETINLNSTPPTVDFLSMLRNESLYNKYAPPTHGLGYATNVSMSMYIEGMSSFSAQNMDFKLDMYFQQEWQDHRLKHSAGARILIRNKELLQLMWKPDLYFANAREASFQEVTDDNFLIWIYEDGTVFYDARISLTVICMMDLSKYPLDKQICDLRILSYAYDESQMTLKWTSAFAPIDRNPAITMPDMHLLSIKTGVCDGTYATGVWSCMTAVFYVQREIMHHMLQTYLPTGLIVVISWFNFWLDVDAAPARVSLSITTLLTIATQANAVKLTLPEVSYMKAIDVWMGVCTFFVFGVMIEFTVCHFARNRQEKVSDNKVGAGIGRSMLATSAMFGNSVATHSPSPRRDSSDSEHREEMEHLNSSFDASPNTEPKRTLSVRRPIIGPNGQATRVSHRISTATSSEKWMSSFRKLQGRRAASKIDEKCRYIFPGSFLVFNIIYWSYYIIVVRLSVFK